MFIPVGNNQRPFGFVAGFIWIIYGYTTIIYRLCMGEICPIASPYPHHIRRSSMIPNIKNLEIPSNHHEITTSIRVNHHKIPRYHHFSWKTNLYLSSFQPVFFAQFQSPRRATRALHSDLIPPDTAMRQRPPPGRIRRPKWPRRCLSRAALPVIFE